MKIFFRNKDTKLRLLDNDTLKIIKNRLFSHDKFYYPAFTRVFFVKEGSKIYLKHSNETLMDHGFVGDVNVEFIGDSITIDELTVFRIDPEGIASRVEKEWGEANLEEIKFILNKKIDPDYSDYSIESYINNSHKKSVEFIKKYDEQLKFIPRIDDLIKTVSIQNIQYELILKNPQSFSEFIKNKFSSGASEEFPFMILKTQKGSKVKALDITLKRYVSKKDFLERQMILLLSKGGDRYIFSVNNNRLIVHSDKRDLNIPEEIKVYVKDTKVMDIRYSGEINMVTNVKKFPELISSFYTSFFVQKDYIRKGNSILLEYSRSIEPIKISIKNSNNSVTTPFVIYNVNSNFHLPFVLSVLQSIFYKSTSVKVARNFFASSQEDDVIQKKEQNIKKLKSKGVDVNSVKCQKERQPSVNNERNIKAIKYELVNKGNRFICNKEPYLFPGFTIDEKVCCFKKDQRKKDIYNRMTGNNINKIKVQASNLVVNDKRIIKDENNNLFHIKSYDPVDIERITDKKEISEISAYGDKIWLKESTLGSVLYTNSKDCKRSPKLIKGEYKCKDIGPLKYHFGYTESSVPCCFKEKRPVIVSKELEEAKNPEEYYDGKYIITTDKSLDKGRIGVLPDEINFMVSNKNVQIKNPQKNEFFRLGTKKNLIDIIKDFKNFEISDIVSQEIFDLSKNTRFKNIGELKEYISNEKYDPIKIIDYISIYTGYNIIVFDFHSDDIEECVNLYGVNKDSLILIKNDGYYEILVRIGPGQKYERSFRKGEEILKNIKKYLKFKCSIKENEFKITFREMLKLVNKDDLKAQIISRVSRKVMFVETKEGILIPVFPSKGIKRNLQIYFIDDISPLNKTQFDTFVEKYMKYYKKIDFINGGVLLNGYMILPTNGNYRSVDVSSISYKPEIFKPVDTDERLDLASKIEKQSEYYYSLRYNFSRLITEDTKTNIKSILANNTSRQSKFQKIRSVVENISSLKNNESKYITQQLLGVNKNDILDQKLPPKKIKMMKLNFSNYKQLFNWLKL